MATVTVPLFWTWEEALNLFWVDYCTILYVVVTTDQRCVYLNCKVKCCSEIDKNQGIQHYYTECPSTTTNQQIKQIRQDWQTP